MVNAPERHLGGVTGVAENAAPPSGEQMAGPQKSEREIAIYIAHMTAEMAAMSRAARLDLLAYFLDMARIEARIQADQAR